MVVEIYITKGDKTRRSFEKENSRPPASSADGSLDPPGRKVGRRRMSRTMKASDSANSLTALYPDEPECFVCLESDNNDKNEPVVHSSILRTCGCKFMVHPICWNEWIKDKTDFDCPICRKDSVVRLRIPNPVLAIEYREDQSSLFQRNMRGTLCGCLLVSIVFTILIISIILWG
jgi:hypothetical protein